jgi:hypothetical protein
MVDPGIPALDSTRSAMQGAVIALPGICSAHAQGPFGPDDGRLYLVSFSV